MALGDSHTCALVTGGVVKCWGDNRKGQLGNPISMFVLGGILDVGLGSGVCAVSEYVIHYMCSTFVSELLILGLNHF